MAKVKNPKREGTKKKGRRNQEIGLAIANANLEAAKVNLESAKIARSREYVTLIHGGLAFLSLLVALGYSLWLT